MEKEAKQARAKFLNVNHVAGSFRVGGVKVYAVLQLEKCGEEGVLQLELWRGDCWHKSFVQKANLGANSIVEEMGLCTSMLWCVQEAVEKFGAENLGQVAEEAVAEMLG